MTKPPIWLYYLIIACGMLALALGIVTACVAIARCL